jgi:isocitrate dehydrogenase
VRDDHPDEARVKEFKLKQMWKSPNGTIRNILDGTIFREPIICKNVPRLVTTGTSPWSSPPTDSATSTARARSSSTDRARSSSPSRPRTAARRSSARSSRRLPRASRWRCTTSTSPSAGFARACFNYALNRNYPVYLSTKNTILKVYDGRFMILFAEIYDKEFRAKFEAAGLTYEHR